MYEVFELNLVLFPFCRFRRNNERYCWQSVAITYKTGLFAETLVFSNSTVGYFKGFRPRCYQPVLKAIEARQSARNRYPSSLTDLSCAEQHYGFIVGSLHPLPQALKGSRLLLIPSSFVLMDGLCQDRDIVFSNLPAFHGLLHATEVRKPGHLLIRTYYFVSCFYCGWISCSETIACWTYSGRSHIFTRPAILFVSYQLLQLFRNHLWWIHVTVPV